MFGEEENKDTHLQFNSEHGSSPGPDVSNDAAAHPHPAEVLLIS